MLPEVYLSSEGPVWNMYICWNLWHKFPYLVHQCWTMFLVVIEQLNHYIFPVLLLSNAIVISIFVQFVIYNWQNIPADQNIAIWILCSSCLYNFRHQFEYTKESSSRHEVVGIHIEIVFKWTRRRPKQSFPVDCIWRQTSFMYSFLKAWSTLIDKDSTFQLSKLYFKWKQA